MELPQQFVDHEKMKKNKEVANMPKTKEYLCIFPLYKSNKQSLMNILLLLLLSHCNCVVFFVVCMAVQALIM